MDSALKAIFRCELLLARRQGSAGFMVLSFFVLSVSLFPLGIGPAPQILSIISSGVIWVAALLATLLSLERLFHIDFEDGSLEQLVLLDCPLELVIVTKVVVHWMVAALPLIILSPLLAILMQMDERVIWTLFISLLIGTPALNFIGAIGAALMVGLKKGSLLMGLIILPFYIPSLIFGVSAIDAAANGLPVVGHLAILGAISLAAMALSPFAAAAALRLSLD